MRGYGFKEKQKHLSDLRSTGMAEIDLSLLKDRKLANLNIEKWGRNPHRFSDEILYALLDVATREEIVSNRRAFSSKAEAEHVAAEKAEAERVAAEKAEAERVAAEKAEAERVAAEKAEAERVAAEKAEDSNPVIEELKAENEELNDTNQELLSEKENLEDQVDQLGTENTVLEKNLEAEKKKVVPTKKKTALKYKNVKSIPR